MPSSSVQALVPTCEATVICAESAVGWCIAACADPANWVAAARAMAVVPAVTDGAGAPEEPGAAAASAAPVLSKVSSAVAPPLVAAPVLVAMGTAPLSDEEDVPPVDAAGALVTGGAVGTPIRALASACSRSVRADEGLPVPDAFVEGSLESSSSAPSDWVVVAVVAPAAFAAFAAATGTAEAAVVGAVAGVMAADCSVAAALVAVLAASVWASAAEKSPSPSVVVAAVCCAADSADDPLLDAPDDARPWVAERAERCPELGAPLELPDRAMRPLPEDLEPVEPELEAFAPDVWDPLGEPCELCDPEEFVAVAPERAVLEPAAADDAEPAGLGDPEDAGLPGESFEDAVVADTGVGGRRSNESAAMGDGPS